MINQSLQGIKIAIENLIPSVIIKSYTIEKGLFSSRMGLQIKRLKSGYIEQTNNSLIYFLFDDLYAVYEIHRDNIPISKDEKKIIKLIPEVISNFETEDDSERIAQLKRLSTRISFENILVSKFIRNGTSNSKFWTPAIILLSFQDLSFKKYEGDSCTSGIVYSSEPERFIKQLHTNYIFEKFDDPLEFNEDFFISPASFRYIDGRNSFYLIDNWRIIKGIIRIKDPNKYSLIQRLNNLHLNEIFDVQSDGRKWVMYVGNNNDINIVIGPKQYLKWERNHWHFRDLTIIHDFLKLRFGNLNFIKSIDRIINSLSELRKGAVILIKPETSNFPPIIGKIDQSKIGNSLRDLFKMRDLNYLEDLNGILGVLSSDGLTTINSEGVVLSCGDIIDSQKASSSNIQGGGRTQAAIASSYFGLSIKVSEDGPISIFENGIKIIDI